MHPAEKAVLKTYAQFIKLRYRGSLKKIYESQGDMAFDVVGQKWLTMGYTKGSVVVVIWPTAKLPSDIIEFVKSLPRNVKYSIGDEQKLLTQKQVLLRISKKVPKKTPIKKEPTRQDKINSVMAHLLDTLD